MSDDDNTPGEEGAEPKGEEPKGEERRRRRSGPVTKGGDKRAAKQFRTRVKTAVYAVPEEYRKVRYPIEDLL